MLVVGSERLEDQLPACEPRHFYGSRHAERDVSLVRPRVVPVCIAVAFEPQLLGGVKRPATAVRRHVSINQRQEVLRAVVR